tara:strand:- start:9699 stop:10214 length:516 start_codon:yes stop_codon:yes gene_type:complete
MAKAKYTSSKGTAMWPWLAKPDTRFDAEGKYKTDLLVKKEDAQEFVDMAKQIFIEEFGEKSLAKAKWPFMNDDEAGGIKIRAKSSKKPTLFDAKGNVIKTDLPVGNGSTIKLSGVMGTYSAGGNIGVTAYLNAVQIIDLVEFGGSTFEEEDGYVHEATESASDATEEFNDF